MGRAVLIKSAIADMRRHPGRLAAVLLAIVISIGYISGTLVFLSTETNAIQESVTARTAGSDVIVRDDGAGPDAVRAARDKIGGLSGVSVANLSYVGHAMSGNGSSAMELQSLTESTQLRWADLQHGSWPEKKGQIAIGSNTAQQRGIGVGDRIRLQESTAPDEGGRNASELTVTGITDQTRSLFSGQSQTAFVPASYLANHSDSAPDLLVVSDGSISPQQLANQIGQVTGKGLTTQTADEYGQQQVEQLTAGVQVFRMLLLIFGAIALLVGGILISNTFLILLVQRRRQIGLLRAVGATGPQVRRSMLAEAVVVGTIGSALGIGAGIGLASVATAISGSLHTGLTVPPTVIAAGLVGVVVTVGAALIPARRATRVSPLAALNPVPSEQVARRVSVLRWVVSLLFAAAGATVIILGLVLDTRPLLMAVAGSMLLAIGWLAATGIFLPGVLKLLGWPARLFGATGRLAAANTVRHPGRAAATAMAIMVAVGLIVTLQVGSSSMKQTMNANLDARYPTDIALTAHNGSLPDGTEQRVASMSDVAATSKVRTSKGKIADTSVRLEAPESGADNVVRSGADAITNGHIVLSPASVKRLGLHAGRTVRVSGPDGRVSLTIVSSHVGHTGAGIVTPKTLQQLAGHATVGALWAKAQPGADVTAVQSELDKIIDDTDLSVGGSLSQKATYAQLMDTMLTLATALLGVAVLIALIGIGNTLALSVAERTRESALLRALGLRRGQLRLMLAIEAVLLAVGGAAVGIVAGAFFGWVGASAVTAEADLAIGRFSMSGPQTITVALIAVVAGVLASILPGRRAVKAAPVQALSEE